MRQLPPAGLVSELHLKTLAQAGAQLAAAHHSGRRQNVWGRAAKGSVKDLKQAVAEIVREFFSSGEAAEALLCVRELGAPAFHHELVKRLIVVAIDGGEREQTLALQLANQMLKEQV